MSDTDLTNGNKADEILKEFLDSVSTFATCQNESTKNLDETFVLANIKLVLDSCVKRASQSKTDMSMKILSMLVENYSRIKFSDKISEHISTILNKSYFEKVSKIFESDNPENAMKMIQLLIEILGKVLHHNLAITNPLLQIVESGFKHTNNEIKSSAYACWACLINNFSLDKNFFFKSKTFRLMLMPLQNKCKTYKEEDVCKAKILAWLSLLENINEKLPTHTITVLIPFLNYCFGLNESVLDYKITHESILDESRTLSSEHHYATLTQIGFELFVSIIFNGDLNWLNRDKDLRKKFKYVNTNKEYNIRVSLKEPNIWLFMIKCFFQLFLSKTNVFDATILLETWKRFCDLLKISFRSPKDTEEKLVKNEKQLVDENDGENDGRFLIAQYFLFNTIELINTSFVNNKPNENKFLIQLIKHLLQAFSVEYHKIFFKNEFNSELLKMIKKAATFLLSSDEDLTGSYLDNIKNLLQLSESHANFIDLENWLYMLNKLNEHFRSIKNKNNLINIREENLETVHLCIIYPIKHFKKLNFQENDIKLVVQICCNLSKTFAGLIKQARLKIENFENLNVNNFCSRVLFNLNQANDSSQDVDGLLYDEIIKLLQIKTQICLQIMQNIFEFDSIKAPNISDNNMEDDTAPVSQATSVSLNFSSSKKVDNSFRTFSNLIEFMQRETKRFYDLVMSQHHTTQAICQASTTSDDSMNGLDSANDAKKSNESSVKQPTQIFCYLIETFSLLFTRVKAHQILNEFLIGFATSIEYTSELHSISKVALSSNTTNTDSPANLLKQKHIHSRLSITNNTASSSSFSFQSNRRSNDLYDTFSMQVASYIQNHLTQTYFTHEFDSILLRKLEPIFYSFLKFSTKMSLKQKTLQAWNSTFGKSTVNSLVYSKRLEKLFIELREDMIRSTNTGGSNQSRSSMGLIAISLPGFKPIDLLNQATNTTNTDDYLSEEKENTPEHLTGTMTAPNEIHVSIGTNHHHLDVLKSTSKDFTNESSNSVPMAQLMMKSTFEANKQLNHLQQSQTQNSTSTNGPNQINSNEAATINFVFSPAGGQNSFLNTFKHISSSASKISSLKQGTPTNEKTNTVVKASPRSLKQNSKRKLDLNALLDQMPDKEFVAIEEKQPITALNCNLLHKYDADKDNNKSSAKFKKPLTEHQKEVRKQKSFIPLEIQSMCSGLEPTMDSQMSFTNDYEDSMQSQSMIMYPTSNEQVYNTRKSLPNLKTTDETFKTHNSVTATILSKPVTTIASSLSQFLATSEEDNANDPMDMDAKDNDDDDYLLASMDMSQAEKRVSIGVAKVDVAEEKIATENTTSQISEATMAPIQPPPTTSVASSLLFNMPGGIKFQSKINPQKQIELVEVNLDNKEVSPPSSYGSVASSFEVNLNGNTSLHPPIHPPTFFVKETEPIIPPISVSNVDKEEIKEIGTNAKVSEPNDEKKTESEGGGNNELKRRSSARLSRKSVLSSTTQDADNTNSSSLVSTTNSTESKLDSTLTNCTFDSFDQSMLCANDDLRGDAVNEDEKQTGKIVPLVRRLKNNKKLFNFYMNSKRTKKAVLTSNDTGKHIRQRVNFKSKPPVMKKFRIGSGTMKFSDKVNHNRRMAKYKRLLHGLKKDPIVNSQLVKNTEVLSDLKDIKEDNIASLVKIALPVPLPINDDQNYKQKVSDKNEALSDDDDENQPLMKLIKKEQSKKQTNATNSTEEQEIIVSKKPPLGTLIEEKKEENASPATSAEVVPSTPNNNRVAHLSTVLTGLPPNGTTSSAQKLNTPTSILKKRGVSKLDMNPLKNSNSLASVCGVVNGSSNDTPSKRRVSFCESIQVEEIEPNFNKSLFSRVTPKAQKSKVVLTPYFNKTNSALNTNSSLTTPLTSNNTLSNETSSTAPNQQNNSAMTSVESLKQNMGTSLQSASNKLSNVIGSQSASKLNSSHRLSDQSCLLSPSFTNTNVITGNQTSSLSVPSSPSLLTNFFSNKQSFLSQRSTKIQELKTNSPQLPSPLNQVPKPINATKTEQTPPTNSDLSSSSSCIYPKFKSSQSSIEALLLNETYCNYLIKGAFKILQSKNIFTIGNLCSITANELNFLPFKSPKMENFLKFIHKFDENETKELENQEVLSKLSACATTTTAAYMGSVEEEMEKLEATNTFDTSIECEKDSDAEKKSRQEIAPTIKMDTNEAPAPQKAQEEDPIKLNIAKDLELMEKDLHEKIIELFKLKHIINSKNVDDIKDVKSKHDELAMQLRMRFY